MIKKLIKKEKKQLNLRHFFVYDINTCIFCLDFQSLGKRTSGFFCHNSRIMGNGRYFSDQSSHGVFFCDQHFFSSACRINSRADPCRSCSDDHYVIHHNFILFSFINCILKCSLNSYYTLGQLFCKIIINYIFINIYYDNRHYIKSGLWIFSKYNMKKTVL